MKLIGYFTSLLMVCQVLIASKRVYYHFETYSAAVT